ncbi:MAG: hypothetical protein IJ104_02035, partial [Methanobrevibacter sp.]|nr:hypothetical protein [Methanobrevibacter sp.]
MVEFFAWETRVREYLISLFQDGWTIVNTGVSGVSLRVNPYMRCAELIVTTSPTFTSSSTKWTDIGTVSAIKNTYTPKQILYFSSADPVTEMRLTTDGVVQYKSTRTSSSYAV